MCMGLTPKTKLSKQVIVQFSVHDFRVLQYEQYYCRVQKGLLTEKGTLLWWEGMHACMQN